MGKKHKKKTLFRILLSTLAIGCIFLASNYKEDSCTDSDSNNDYRRTCIDDEFSDESNQCNA